MNRNRVRKVKRVNIPNINKINYEVRLLRLPHSY